MDLLVELPRRRDSRAVRGRPARLRRPRVDRRLRQHTMGERGEHRPAWPRSGRRDHAPDADANPGRSACERACTATKRPEPASEVTYHDGPLVPPRHSARCSASGEKAQATRRHHPRRLGQPPPTPPRRHRPPRQHRRSSLRPLRRTHSRWRGMAPRPRRHSRRLLRPGHARCNLAAGAVNGRRPQTRQPFSGPTAGHNAGSTTRPSARSTSTADATPRSIPATANGSRWINDTLNHGPAFGNVPQNVGGGVLSSGV